MELRFCPNASFFGLTRDRFVQYQPARTTEEKIALMAGIEGVSGIELKYPADFGDVSLVERLLSKHGLALPVINVDTKDATHFLHGALSARSEAARGHAVKLLTDAMDLAAKLGAETITTCPLADGYDYPFQIDYETAWANFIDTVKQAGSHRSDIKLLLEYQPHDPHARILLNDVGKALYVCAEVGLDNVGVNMDIGHSFAAREAPAEAATLLARAGRLSYIHTNDNTGEGGDWDMISGSVHFWHWLELLYTLDRVGYDGWLGGDVSPKHFGPAEAYGANILMIRRMAEIIDRLGADKIAELVAKEGNTPETYAYLSSALVAGSDSR